VQQNAANIAATAGGTGGMFMFLSDNAPVFGLILSAVSICIAWRYYHLNYKINCARMRIAIEDSENGVSQKFSEKEMEMYDKVLKRRLKRREKNKKAP